MNKALLRRLGFSRRHPWLLKLQKAQRRLLGTDTKLREQYFQSAKCRKLHLGSSKHLLEGWLNTDLYPGRDVMQLDATARYPFETDSFDFIFTEHMIEHVPYPAAIAMLSECYRVLKPGGVIRVATPDLAKILNIYPHPKDELGQKYLSWISNRYTPDITEDHAAHVVNALFRLWGHQFLYDVPTLTTTLVKCGFSSIEQFELGESKHADLQNLENTSRYPDGLLNYESICLEATKMSLC